MKLARYGLAFIFLLYFSVIYLMTIDNHHRLKFTFNIKLVPVNHYKFDTCTEFLFTIDKVTFFDGQYGANGDCEWK